MCTSARRAPWRSRTFSAMCWASVSARSALSPSTTSPSASLTTSSKRLMCAPFWWGPRSTKQSRRAEYSCSAPLAAIRMTFSPFVTPTRKSESERVGDRFWTSSKDRVMTPRLGRGAETGRMTQGFAKDKPRIACYKARKAQTSSPDPRRVNHELGPLATEVATPLLGRQNTRIGTEGAAPEARVPLELRPEGLRVGHQDRSTAGGRGGDHRDRRAPPADCRRPGKGVPDRRADRFLARGGGGNQGAGGRAARLPAGPGHRGAVG